MNVLGIDVGFNGSLAVLTPALAVEIFDAPTLSISNGRRTHAEMDVAGIVALLRPYQAQGCHVFMERVGVMPGQGIASSGAFMRGFGQWEGVLAALGLPYTLVHPARWKRAMLDGQGKDKDASRQRAAQLFPVVAHLLSRKKDDGRAEALLLAEYGRRVLAGGTEAQLIGAAQTSNPA